VIITHARPPANEVYVYVFWKLKGTVAGFVSSARPKEIAISKDAPLKTLAHEFGHVLGVAGDYPGIGDVEDDLMAHGTGKRIHKRTADEAN